MLPSGSALLVLLDNFLRQFKIAARAHALMQGRDFVIPQDVKNVAPDILRHRVALTYRAEAAGVDSDTLVNRILASVDIESASG